MSEFTDFASGLKDLTDAFKSDIQENTDKYTSYFNEAKQEFQDTSHAYGQYMMQRSNQYLQDMASLYEEVYGENPLNPPAESKA